MSELQKDVERELEKLPEAERDAKRTQFAVFVVHNKLKPKLAELPAGIPCVRLLAYARLPPPLPLLPLPFVFHAGPSGAGRVRTAFSRD